MTVLVDELKSNPILQAILIKNNPGANSVLGSTLYDSIVQKLDNQSNELHANGFARLEVLNPRVTWLLKSWMRLQLEETAFFIKLDSKQVPAKGYQKPQPVALDSLKDELVKNYSVLSYVEQLPRDLVLNAERKVGRDVIISSNSSMNAAQQHPVLYEYDFLPADHGHDSASGHQMPLRVSSANKSGRDRYDISGISASYEQDYRGGGGGGVRRNMGTGAAAFDEADDYPLKGQGKADVTSVDSTALALDRSVPVASPSDKASKKRDKTRRGEVSDAPEAWDYWPEERKGRYSANGASGGQDRPPSRISIRPRSGSGSGPGKETSASFRASTPTDLRRARPTSARDHHRAVHHSTDDSALMRRERRPPSNKTLSHSAAGKCLSRQYLWNVIVVHGLTVFRCLCGC